MNYRIRFFLPVILCQLLFLANSAWAITDTMEQPELQRLNALVFQVLSGSDVSIGTVVTEYNATKEAVSKIAKNPRAAKALTDECVNNQIRLLFYLCLKPDDIASVSHLGVGLTGDEAALNSLKVAADECRQFEKMRGSPVVFARDWSALTAMLISRRSIDQLTHAPIFDVAELSLLYANRLELARRFVRYQGKVIPKNVGLDTRLVFDQYSREHGFTCLFTFYPLFEATGRIKGGDIDYPKTSGEVAGCFEQVAQKLQHTIILRWILVGSVLLLILACLYIAMRGFRHPKANSV